MAFFNNPDSLRKLGILGGGALLAATGNPLGLLIPNLYASALERGQRRDQMNAASQALTSPQYVYDPGGAVLDTNTLSGPQFDQNYVRNLPQANMQQRMRIPAVQNAVMGAVPPETLLGEAAKQMFSTPETPATFNVIDTQNNAARPFAVTEAGLAQLNARMPGRYARAGEYAPPRVDRPTPRTPLAQARDDLTNNFITQDQYNQIVARETAPAQDKGTPAQNAVDSQFGKDYAEWVTGGSADVAKSLTQLTEAMSSLQGGENLTGPYLGLLPDSVRTITNPESVNVQEQVQEVAQRNLRLVLGAQFTEREGDRLIARVYNPRLDEATNLKRVQLLTDQIKQAAEAKEAAAQYYEQNGTLRGFTGKVYRFSDFETELNDRLRQSETPADAPQIGTVEDGYEYIGGDPSKPESWRRL